MRVFYLRLQKSDFVSTSNNRWVSPVIDLYDNDWYTNFSTVKSSYGLNNLGSFVWVGLLREALGSWLQFRYFTWEEIANRTWRSEEGLNTDSGRVLDGRFIDTSGRVNIISFNVDVATNPYAAATPTLDVYTSEFSSAHFPEEWAGHTRLATSDEIDVEESPQYARFALNFAADPGIAYDATLWIRVEIDEPNMFPLYNETRNILDLFPKWMALREADNVNHSTPALATPISLGGKVINAVAGEWLDDINQHLTYLELQHYIETLDMNQKAWAYKVSRTPDRIYSVVGDGLRVGQAVDQKELLEALDDEDVYWWDQDSDTLYLTKAYTTLTINGVAYLQEPHHIWNYLDEIGLLVDLRRLTLEGNESYRHRILDVYQNLPGVGNEAFKLAVRRELNMWKYESPSATPSSNYQGATPEILEMSDIETDPAYVAPDGMSTDKFDTLVQRLSYQYPTTWGRFKWDKAVWDVGGDQNTGYNVLPYRMDATPLYPEITQSGVGDGNDLYVFRPDAVTGPHDFAVRLKIRGRQKTPQTEYPAVKLNFEIYGQADRKIYNNPSNAVWLSAEVLTYDPVSTTYVASFQLTAKSDVDVNRVSPSPASRAVQDLFSMDDTTHTSLVFVNKTTGATYTGPAATPSSDGRIPAWNISSITMKHGQWNVGSQTYVNKEVADTFGAWYSHQTSPVLIWNTSSGFPSVVGSSSDPKVLPRPSVVMESKETSFVVGKWISETIPYKLTLNGISPVTSSNSIVVTMPTIAWDQFLETTPNKEYVIRLTTNSGDATPYLWGGTTTASSGQPVFLPASPYIQVNGDSTWAGGRTKTLSGGTTTVTFSTGSSALYPITGYTWTLFEAAQTSTFTGVVDENGPWRNGIAPDSGNTNFALMTANVGRTNFGISQSTNYVVTWMGVDVVGDDRVLAWLDNNTVQPAVVDDTSVIYPESAIQEQLVSGSYLFEPFIIRARLRPNVGPEWNPQIHSGWFYNKQNEYYFYAKPLKESVTSATPILAGVSRQGAPISAKTNEATPKEFRQVAFFDEAASPVSLSHTNKQRMKGNGTTSLYLAYPDVYNAAATNLTTGAVVGLTSTTTSTNVLTTTTATNKNHTYEVSYKLKNSFFVNNDHQSATPFSTNYSRLFFDKSPAQLGVSDFTVTYENSIFNPATPVDLPLSPLYTTQDEGFIFIAFDEYTLDRIILYISPSKIIADGQDYLLLSLRAEDSYGNPKGAQLFNITSTFGTLDKAQIKTDRDGFALALLTSASSTATLTGQINVSSVVGGLTASIPFDIDPTAVRPYQISAVVSAEQVPADGKSKVVIYGKVTDSNFAPISQAQVKWKRARSIYDLFRPGAPTTTVTADTKGAFTIGPLTTQTVDKSGYWFMSLETNSAVGGATWTTVGDVIFWHEYPEAIDGVENMTGLPRPPIQMATPIGTIPPYASGNYFPSYYDEATPYAPATPVTIVWEPPTWYTIDLYVQYQIGKLGTLRGILNISFLNQIHPHRKHF